MLIVRAIPAVLVLALTSAPLTEPRISDLVYGNDWLLDVDEPSRRAPTTDEPLARLEYIVRMILQESNGEPERGMVAVAAVALDRVSHGNWPDNERDVVYQRRQFAGMSLRIKNYTPMEIRLARDAVSLARGGVRPCGTAYWFHATWMPRRPPWAPRLLSLCVIGGHEFYGFLP